MHSTITRTYLYRDRQDGFFDNLKKCLHFSANTERVDKFFKLADKAILPVSSILANHFDASENTMEDIATIHQGVKITRSVTAIISIFSGVLEGMYFVSQQIVTLAKGLWNRDDMVDLAIEKAEVDPGGPRRHNQLAVGRFEISVKLAALVNKLIGMLAFTAAFSGPYQVGTYCRYLERKEEKALRMGVEPRKAELTPGKATIADAFLPIIFVNHITTVVGNVFELVYQKVAFDRAVRDTDSDNASSIKKEYQDRLIECTLGLVEKTLETVSDIVVFAKEVLPSPVRISLDVIGSSICFVRTWRKTT